VSVGSLKQGIPSQFLSTTAVVSTYHRDRGGIPLNSHLKIIFCLPPRLFPKPQWYKPAFKNYFLATTIVVSRTAVVSPYNINIKKLFVPTIAVLERTVVVSLARCLVGNTIEVFVYNRGGIIALNFKDATALFFSAVP